MAEKQGFWSSIIHGDEREQQLRSMQKGLEQLSKEKDIELDIIWNVSSELKRRMLNEVEENEKEKIKGRIELLALEKVAIKKAYLYKKSEKQIAIKLYKLETKLISFEDNENKTNVIEKKISDLREEHDVKIESLEKEMKQANYDYGKMKSGQWKERLIELNNDNLSDDEIEQYKVSWEKRLLPNKNKTSTSYSESSNSSVSLSFGSLKLEHLGGHPKLKKGNVTIKAGDSSGALKIGNKSITVNGMGWEEKGKRSGGKAAAGAVVGGIVTAPITWGAGAIVGAAIGGRKKDDSVVAIAFSDGNVNYTMYLKADAKEYQKLCKLLA
ncbi:hypothetical protein [Shouchella miscanthi]|uniref:hypothetical protein n=1 Tax=Shouchella miscanthi TaxID=2598861 RepID=UPI00119D2012|nr:hypothetical protein [Shouchella miscanthi]